MSLCCSNKKSTMEVFTEKICYVINKINENKLSQIIFYENMLGNPPLFSIEYEVKFVHPASQHRTHQELDKSNAAEGFT